MSYFFPLLSQILKKAAKAQENIICSNNSKNFEIVGSTLLKTSLTLFLFDVSAGHHLVLFVPANEVAAYLPAGTIPLKNTTTALSLTSAFGFDPALEPGKKPRQLATVKAFAPEDVENQLPPNQEPKAILELLFFYDPAESRKRLPPKQKHLEVRVLDDQATGLLFVQCAPFEGGAHALTWCVQDIEVKNRKEWFTSNVWSSSAASASNGVSESPNFVSATQVSITVVEVPMQAIELPQNSTSSKAEDTIVSLLFVESAHVSIVLAKLKEDQGRSGYPVRWRRLNGFIIRQDGNSGNGLVVLFADNFVYTFEDRYGSNRYLFTLDLWTELGGTPAISFPFAVFAALKAPKERYFSCNGTLFPDRLKLLLLLSGSGSLKDEPLFGRAALIYALFLAHFFVAAVMICTIVCMTACEMTGKEGKKLGKLKGRKRRSEKRVRKGYRLTPPSERGQLLKTSGTGKESRKSKSVKSKSSSSQSRSSVTKSVSVSASASASSKSSQRKYIQSGPQQKSNFSSRSSDQQQTQMSFAL
ncbi:hypothetical protein TYRP_016176 [Tyrophagus putrescentiae]|nr:hypothetical protein TYRP_016176 [Tyrophagus putrescentiae]